MRAAAASNPPNDQNQTIDPDEGSVELTTAGVGTGVLVKVWAATIACGDEELTGVFVGEGTAVDVGAGVWLGAGPGTAVAACGIPPRAMVGTGVAVRALAAASAADVGVGA